MNRRRFLGTMAAAQAIAMLSGGSGCSRSADRRRVILLAFDGMDPRIAERYASEGRMPASASLAGGSGYGRLASTMPPQSPVAWSSFITGKGPEVHGIYDFVARHPEDLSPFLSTSAVVPPADYLSLGGWRLPMSGGGPVLLRKGEPFWRRLTENGIPASFYHLPVDFPPAQASGARILSGLGTPDIRGSQGSFTFFTDDPLLLSDDTSGGRTVAVRDSGAGTFEFDVEGPANAFREGSPPALSHIVLRVDAAARTALLETRGARILLEQGVWSGWTRVDFSLIPGVTTAESYGRFLLRSASPRLELYLSPLNMSPFDPAMPVSAPSWWSRELATRVGPFATKGLPEDTKALSRGFLDDEEYIGQAMLLADEQIRMFEDQMASFRDGLFFYYFTCLDLNMHMFYRALDTLSPLHSSVFRGGAAFIAAMYSRMDSVIATALEHADDRTLVLVCSDHGFAPFRRGFDLNAWLVASGYMQGTSLGSSSEPYQGVDWSRTAAYGLGINGLYLNIRGREGAGCVDPAESHDLLRRLCRDLESVTDPSTGMRIVARTEATSLTTGPSTPAGAPDVIVGYSPGYRSSWGTALGSLGREIVMDNLDPWSGDHCVAPEFVPGTLLANRPISREGMELREVGLLAAGYLLQETLEDGL